MQSGCYLRTQHREAPNLTKRKFKMTNVNIQNHVAAAFAALFSAAILVAASVGPAVQNSAALIA